MAADDSGAKRGERKIWIETVPESEASGLLAEIYADRRRLGQRLGTRLKAVSLWPEMLAAREAVERELRRGCVIRRRRREMITVVTASLIGCHF